MDALTVIWLTASVVLFLLATLVCKLDLDDYPDLNRELPYRDNSPDSPDSYFYTTRPTPPPSADIEKGRYFKKVAGNAFIAAAMLHIAAVICVVLLLPKLNSIVVCVVSTMLFSAAAVIYALLKAKNKSKGKRRG